MRSHTVQVEIVHSRTLFVLHLFRSPLSALLLSPACANCSSFLRAPIMFTQSRTKRPPHITTTSCPSQHLTVLFRTKSEQIARIEQRATQCSLVQTIIQTFLRFSNSSPVTILFSSALIAFILSVFHCIGNFSRTLTRFHVFSLILSRFHVLSQILVMLRYLH